MLQLHQGGLLMMGGGQSQRKKCRSLARDRDATHDEPSDPPKSESKTPKQGTESRT
jgi:hypothetical protein